MNVLSTRFCLFSAAWIEFNIPVKRLLTGKISSFLFPSAQNAAPDALKAGERAAVYWAHYFGSFGTKRERRFSTQIYAQDRWCFSPQVG
jgi:hypothetical protein